MTIIVFLAYDADYGALPMGNHYFLLSPVLNFNFGMIYALVLRTISSRAKDVHRLIEQQDGKKFTPKYKPIMTVYSELQDILSITNKYFSWNSMILFVEYTLHCFIMLLAFYDLYTREFPLDSILYFISGIGYQFPLQVYTLFLMKQSENLKHDGMKISQKINTRIIFSKVEKDEKFGQIFALQSKSPLTASCGLFDFGWKMIFIAISTSFSYLLVAIQFDMTIHN